MTKVYSEKAFIFPQIFEKEKLNLQNANKLYNSNIYDLFNSKKLTFGKIFFILYDIAYIRRIYIILFGYFDHYFLKFPSDNIFDKNIKMEVDSKDDSGIFEKSFKTDNHAGRHRKHNFYNISKTQTFSKTNYNKITLNVFLIKYFGKEPKNLEIHNGSFTILNSTIKVNYF
jgi:hypothetical protein